MFSLVLFITKVKNKIVKYTFLLQSKSLSKDCKKCNVSKLKKNKKRLLLSTKIYGLKFKYFILDPL